MLTTIREKTQGIIATIILSLLALTFVVWGISSYRDRDTHAEVASVNGDKISEQAYRAALEGFRRRLDPRMANGPEIKKFVIDSLIDQSLLVHDADAQGYRISDKRLADAIQQLPYFRSGGQFNSDLYHSLLQREGVSVHEFEQQRRADGITAQIQAGFSESGLVTESEIAAVLRLWQQKRDVAYALIGTDKFLAGVSPSAEAIEQYYQAHMGFFTTAEQVRVEYVRLSPADMIHDYQPTDAELRTAYAAESANNARLAQRRVAHILIPLSPGASEDDAKKALAKVEEAERKARAGQDFAALARSYSEDKDSATRGG